jgi:DNA-directed RNA polymerase subunit RPC12/RpoP
MKKVRYVCKKCGHRFIAEVLEPGEAEEKRLSTRPILCERCGGSVERD